MKTFVTVLLFLSSRPKWRDLFKAQGIRHKAQVGADTIRPKEERRMVGGTAAVFDRRMRNEK